MILRIRTPEEVFRSEKCDLYFLNFRELDIRQQERTRHEMRQWLHHHLPNSPVEFLGPSEHSTVVEGGPTYMRVAFTDADLKKFCDRWEDQQGQSVDRRFQCRLLSYQEWWDTHGHHSPTFDRPTGPGTSRWFVTPKGILSHVLDHQLFKTHPASKADLWCNACKKWPELNEHDPHSMLSGHVRYNKTNDSWSFFYEEPVSPNTAIEEEIAIVLYWLRIPPERTIHHLNAE